MTDFANGFFKIRSPHGNWVVRKEHAAFKIFESVTCQLDRSTEQHPEHLNYLGRLRQDVISSILQFLKHSEGAYIELKKVEITISLFRNQYLFKKYSTNYAPSHDLKMMGMGGFVRMGDGTFRKWTFRKSCNTGEWMNFRLQKLFSGFQMCFF
ncbi:hypothetical protein B9Z55_009201 [Caenorhabditis nigoni]|uniref:Uncharacterized protein n=1 Tax=Caenorhabditis nigoni TaxID=1611254 RepID=A0A2G5UQZ3_9PELO|nr:hypothetical protein B9Z55_009201 [Caenorhabditis nigoni]